MAKYDHIVKANRKWYQPGEEVPESIDPSAYPSDDSSGGSSVVDTTRLIELETS